MSTHGHYFSDIEAIRTITVNTLDTEIAELAKNEVMKPMVWVEDWEKMGPRWIEERGMF